MSVDHPASSADSCRPAPSTHPWTDPRAGIVVRSTDLRAWAVHSDAHSMPELICVGRCFGTTAQLS
jgi:hypothetical protein